MRAVRENRDYGSAVRVRYKRLLKMRIRFSPFRGCGTGEPSLTFPRGRKKPSRRFVVCLYSRKAGIRKREYFIKEN